MEIPKIYKKSKIIGKSIVLNDEFDDYTIFFVNKPLEWDSNSYIQFKVEKFEDDCMLGFGICTLKENCSKKYLGDFESVFFLFYFYY